MKRFLLQRLEDETGISGEGIIAEGVQFTNGTIVLVWLTEIHSIAAIYESIEIMDQIHGHNGKTIVEWVDFEIDITITDSNGRSVVKRHPVIVSEALNWPR